MSSHEHKWAELNYRLGIDTLGRRVQVDIEYLYQGIIGKVEEIQRSRLH